MTNGEKLQKEVGTAEMFAEFVEENFFCCEFCTFAYGDCANSHCDEGRKAWYNTEADE